MLVLEVWGLTRDSVPVLFLLSGQRVPSRMNLLDLELSGAQFGIVFAQIQLDVSCIIKILLDSWTVCIA